MADIIVDTYKLNQCANRIADVNKRIVNLDRRMNTLYTKVGLSELWNLLQADRLTFYNWRLTRCQSYLLQTAADFEALEKSLANLDLTDFEVGTAEAIADLLDKADDKKDERSWFAKFINNDLNASGSLISGEAGAAGEFLGIGVAGTASGSILTGEAGIESKISWEFTDEDGNLDFSEFGISTVAKATGSLAKGEVKGNLGYLNGRLSGEAITGTVQGEAKFALYEDGKFNPSLFFGAKAEGSVLHGEADVGFGTDQYGVHVNAEGDLLHAEAEAKAGVGYIGTDDDGNAMYGAAAEVSAMACLAQGEVKGGVTIFGIDIDIGTKGYAGAVGVEAGASITTEGATAGFGGALGLGGKVEISVDWSDAKWIGESIDAVGGFVEDTTEFVGDTIDKVGDVANDFMDSVADTAEDVGDFLFGWI